MDILQSKKFQAAVVGLLMVILETYVPGLTDLPVNEMLAVIVAYIVGQGIADAGKERAKIEQGK